MKQRVEIHNIICKKALFAVMAYGLIRAWWEFETIAWGTGNWLGKFSLKWGLAFVLFTILCLICLVGVWLVLRDSQKIIAWFGPVVRIRQRIGVLRWLLSVAILIAPVWLLQYTTWGAVLYRPYLRLLIWAFSLLLLGMLFTRGETPLSWPGYLAGLVLTAGVFVFAIPLRNIAGYPFSLGWSEGNRLWDYSILFGRHLYDYPLDLDIPVLLDIGRQLVGGIPFIFPNVSIVGARLWMALTLTIPFLVLGLVAFYLPRKPLFIWLLAGLWAFTFLEQGPIHPPLVLCAILVALAWQRPLWIAMPLVLVAGYFAQVSRWTWMLAPGMWAGMLELCGVVRMNCALDRKDWMRAVTVGATGVFGGYVLPFLVDAIRDRIGIWQQGETADIINSLGGGVTPLAVKSAVSSQPLLWYRLLPNATYGSGILLGLLVAIAPLVIILVYLARTHRWPLTSWQKLALILPLLAFLVVGLIVSVKIGGGGDLHNLDMFLIGMMFAGAIAWRNGGDKLFFGIDTTSFWMRIVVVLLVAIPAYKALMQLFPLSFADDLPWVMILTDKHQRDSLKTLPAHDDTERALSVIREEIAAALPDGDILFMDQRQLLTFRFVTGVPLVPEYEKKELINRAMSADAAYFKTFYRDLATHRFSLIISNPLYERVKEKSYQFGEENNTWVHWVASPVLCYYKPEVTLKHVRVQLLVPRQDVTDCSQLLP